MSRKRNEFLWHEAGSGRTGNDSTTATGAPSGSPNGENDKGENADGEEKEEPQYYYGSATVEQQRYYTGANRLTRCEVADALYPDKPTNELRCRAVNSDIYSNEELHQKMVAEGWVSGGRGYSPGMIKHLSEFHHKDIDALVKELRLKKGKK